MVLILEFEMDDFRMVRCISHVEAERRKSAFIEVLKGCWIRGSLMDTAQQAVLTMEVMQALLAAPRRQGYRIVGPTV